MRVDSFKLPPAALQNGKPQAADKAFQAEKTFPGVPADKANPNATTRRPGVEATTPPATIAETPASSGEKLTPAGLLAAQLRFQGISEADRTPGQSRAFEVISRNIERYQEKHGITSAETSASSNVATPPVATAGNESDSTTA